MNMESWGHGSRELSSNAARWVFSFWLKAFGKRVRWGRGAVGCLLSFTHDGL